MGKESASEENLYPFFLYFQSYQQNDWSTYLILDWDIASRDMTLKKSASKIAASKAIPANKVIKSHIT